MINKKFQNLFQQYWVTLRGVAGPHPFLAKIRVWFFSKLCLHGVAYDMERLFEKFSDIFGQPERRGSAIPIFRKCLHHTYFGIK